ncbi:hypothetical protein OHS18_05840 [Amycolatopsis sp. NBC_00355]|uniref:hypothetical protein n=1 Tax=Amycolatopsis sp. NBC_00355 TaxID=2975957 RepID=UPI002E274D9A
MHILPEKWVAGLHHEEQVDSLHLINQYCALHETRGLGPKEREVLDELLRTAEEFVHEVAGQLAALESTVATALAAVPFKEAEETREALDSIVVAAAQWNAWPFHTILDRLKDDNRQIIEAYDMNHYPVLADYLAEFDSAYLDGVNELRGLLADWLPEFHKPDESFDGTSYRAKNALQELGKIDEGLLRLHSVLSAGGHLVHNWHANYAEILQVIKADLAELAAAF